MSRYSCKRGWKQNPAKLIYRFISFLEKGPGVEEWARKSGFLPLEGVFRRCQLLLMSCEQHICSVALHGSQPPLWLRTESWRMCFLDQPPQAAGVHKKVFHRGLDRVTHTHLRRVWRQQCSALETTGLWDRKSRCAWAWLCKRGGDSLSA